MSLKTPASLEHKRRLRAVTQNRLPHANIGFFGLAVDGISANYLQDAFGVEFVAVHFFSMFSTEGLQEAFLQGETTTVLESLSNLAGRIVILIPRGSGHEVDVREGCEAGPDEGAAHRYWLRKDMCSE